MPNFKHGLPSFRRQNIQIPGLDLNVVVLISQLKIVYSELGKSGVVAFLRETEKRNDLPTGTLKELENIEGDDPQ